MVFSFLLTTQIISEIFSLHLCGVPFRSLERDTAQWFPEVVGVTFCFFFSNSMAFLWFSLVFKRSQGKYFSLFFANYFIVRNSFSCLLLMITNMCQVLPWPGSCSKCPSYSNSSSPHMLLLLHLTDEETEATAVDNAQWSCPHTNSDKLAVVLINGKPMTLSPFCKRAG